MLRLVEVKEADPGDGPAIERKELTEFEVKVAETGEVEAIVATLGVVDKDGDIILPGAIKSGSKVTMSSYGHDLVMSFSPALPVGKGKMVVEEAKAIYRGKMFMSTERGRETHAVLKEMGPDQQWSFGFRVIGWEVPDDDMRKKGARRILTKLDAFEVSPVIIGAGVGTRTLSVKSEDPPPPPGPTAEEKAAAEKKAADEAANAEAKRLADERAAAELKQVASEEFARFERTRRRIAIA